LTKVPSTVYYALVYLDLVLALTTTTTTMKGDATGEVYLDAKMMKNHPQTSLIHPISLKVLRD
jgi:hypothetical protein